MLGGMVQILQVSTVLENVMQLLPNLQFQA